MGFFDFLFGKKNEENAPQIKHNSSSETKPISTEQNSTSTQSKVPLSMEPFVFNSTCHQRYEHGSEVMGLQECGRTIRVEKNTNGCRGYKLAPGDGYIVKIFNDDLGKPNMSDKPMRIVSKTSDKVKLRGFPIEAQTPFGWQEVDYREYGLTIYYTNGVVSKCVLHMFDRNVDLEYRKTSVSSSVKDESQLNSMVPTVKDIAQGAPFTFNFEVTAVKQYYNGSSEQVKLNTKVTAIMTRAEKGGNVLIGFSDLDALKSRGVIRTNLSLTPDFSYNRDAEGNEFASAEINNSWAAMSSGNEYISLFQITKQKGNIVSFIINNLPGDQDFYYLIMFRQ